MDNFQTVICSNCDGLRELYDHIECSIYNLINNKWINKTYNTTLYYNELQYQRLIRYKKIVYKKLYNSSYPCAEWTYQKIKSLVIHLLYNPTRCANCPCEDFSEFLTTTTQLP